MHSFIDCIHYITKNFKNYYSNGEKLIYDINFIIEPRISTAQHELINTSKLYENVINYAKKYWTKENLKSIRNIINKYKNNTNYNRVTKFLNKL